MGIGCAIYLEENSKVSELLRGINSIGIETITQQPGQRLHLTLINGDGGSLEKFIKNVGNITLALREIEFEELCFFEQSNCVAYISVSDQTKLLLQAFHQSILRSAESAGVSIREHYNRENWTPHISLAGSLTKRSIKHIQEIDFDPNGSSSQISGYGIATWFDSVVTIEKEWTIEQTPSRDSIHAQNAVVTPCGR